jgi:DNA replication licensing factor MCM4
MLEGDPSATGVSSETDQVPQLVVWGTNVVVSQCKEKFKKFVLRFVDPNAEEDERIEDMNLNEPLYLQKLQEVCIQKGKVLGWKSCGITLRKHL